MCGISGKLDWSGAPSIRDVERMNAAMLHRGPDSGGVRQVGCATLGHRRLAIIDLSPAGNQPMSDHTGTVWIVFNGEIYNFESLRAELQKLGSRFVSKTDTEVILEAYKMWGKQCLQQLNGMFAFALWDSNRQSLFLARDRLGKKPLFYYKRPSGLSFASELPALLQDSEIQDGINERAIIQYLAIGYVTGSECVHPGIAKLPPGHSLLWERGKLPEIAQFWDLSKAFVNKRNFRNQDAAIEEFKELLYDAVKIRLMSDVPLGAFLSGGIDSSSVVAALRSMLPKQRCRTFSVGFHERSFNELEEANAAASRLDVQHYAEFISGETLRDLTTIARCVGEPFADTSIIPMYYLSNFTRKSVTVALSGDGADEILGGYETYIADRIHHIIKHTPKPLVRAIERAYRHLMPRNFGKVSMDYKILQFLRGCSLPPARAHYSWRELFSSAELTALLRPRFRGEIEDASPCKIFERFDSEVVGCHYLDRAMYVDIKTWLADDILVKVDRATMAHSLEARAPFLDYRLVEFAASLPPEMKVRFLTKKYTLKRSQEGILPKSILNRPKRGFNSPISQWLFCELGEICEEMKYSSPVFDYVLPEGFTSLVEDHLERRVDNSFRLFALINLHLWLTGRIRQDNLHRAA